MLILEFFILCFHLSTCARNEMPNSQGRPQRLVLEENYDQIVGQLATLSAKVEVLESARANCCHRAPVAFMAYLSKTISGGQKQNILYDNVITNVGNAYNIHHGNFIAPVNGTYQFSLYACSHTSHTIVLDLMKSTTTVGRLLAGDADYSSCSSKTFVIDLQKGDDIYVNEGTYGDLLYVNPTYGLPSFTGVLI